MTLPGSASLAPLRSKPSGIMTATTTPSLLHGSSNITGTSYVPAPISAVSQDRLRSFCWTPSILALLGVGVQVPGGGLGHDVGVLVAEWHHQLYTSLITPHVRT